jgi:hypothetical protein
LERATNKKIENFNLIVRSANSMSEDFKNGILEIFQNTQALYGIKGFIKFEQVNNFPVNPAQDIISQLLTIDEKYQA